MASAQAIPHMTGQGAKARNTRDSISREGGLQSVWNGTRMDTTLLRRAMGRFATGVTVVTTRTPDGKFEGVTANSFSTVSLDPPLVLWSLGRKSASFASFATASHFTVNVLGLHQLALSQHFSTPKHDKLSGIDHSLGYGGCPVLAGTIAHFECETQSVIEGGDHSIFIGRVLNASFHDGEPLVFAKGAYHRAIALVEEVAS
jgi:flavin reductase (DIM6/NTAB) family NADH-FMN oxidoreductase RutF